MSNLKRLSNEFYRIQCMNWIKNVGKGYSSAGKTLENILGKTDDYESLPDFEPAEGWEIPVVLRYPVKLRSYPW